MRAPGMNVLRDFLFVLLCHSGVNFLFACDLHRPDLNSKDERIPRWLSSRDRARIDEKPFVW